VRAELRFDPAAFADAARSFDRSRCDAPPCWRVRLGLSAHTSSLGDAG
jgi:hypothetical protein